MNVKKSFLITNKKMEDRNNIFICPHCCESFQKKRAYNDHILMCDILKNQKVYHEEDKNILKLDQIQKIVLHLLKDNKSLRKKIDKMQKYVETTKKKLNIIDWLNDNYKEIEDFDEFLNKINITEVHIKYLLSNSFIKGTYFILQDLFPIGCNDNPIKCFDQKQNTLFIYSNKKKSWVIMSNIELESFINILFKNIIKIFYEWQTKQNENYFCTPSYENDIIKIMGGDNNKSQLFNQVKNKLFNHLKFNLKQVVEFEFE